MPRLRAARSVLAALVVAALSVTAGCASGEDSPTTGTSAAVPTPPDAGGDTEDGEPAGGAPGSGPAAPSDRPSADRTAEQTGRPGRPAWCAPDDLGLRLRPLRPEAGNHYAALVFVNTSDRPCRTRGWPGLQLTRDGGEKIPTTVHRDRSVPAVQLTLAPGERAWSRLHWTVVPSGDAPEDGRCPEPSGLRAIPPDRYEALAADWTAGAVCGGRIDARPLTAGGGPTR